MSAAVKFNHKTFKKSLVDEGFEFPSKLVYRGWEPGGEYTLPLVVKNIKLTTQKLKFRISSNQFTSPVHHQPLILCSGTSYTLPITFRPCEKNPCEEHIDFETADGQLFKIPIKAVLPCPKLTLTEQLKFGMCAVKHCIKVDFEMSNIGNVPASYSWQVPEDFDISPRSGNLSPKETCKLSASFTPESAKMYKTFATCTYNEERKLMYQEPTKFTPQTRKMMKLEGIGKYPYVTVKPSYIKGRSFEEQYSGNKEIEFTQAKFSYNDNKKDEMVYKEITVDFGCIGVGSSAENWIEVTNPSPVSCTFSVHHYSASSDTYATVFSCNDYKKTIQPYTSTKVKLMYTPDLLRDYKDVAYFIVHALGGCGCTRIKCVGQSQGPKVCILNEDSIVNFGSVHCGNESHGGIYIENKSDIPASFQVQLYEGNVFSCDLQSGDMRPHSTMSISVKFMPQNPIPYHRMISLLIKYQDPLYLHLIGNGYSEAQIPALLKPRDVLNYLVHAQSGISLLPPEQLRELLDKGILASCINATLVPSSQSKFSNPPLPEKFVSYTSGFARYFHSEYEPSGVLHITADTDTIKFGYCSPTFSSDGKTIAISNHTYGEVTCMWMTANVESFIIVPSERRILPNKSASFTIYFKPENPNQFYSTHVECYVFYKDLIDGSRVDPLTLCPSWCIVAHLSGHTFSKDFSSIPPELAFDTTNVVFPPSIPGLPVYQTVAITNGGNAPIVYDIPEDSDKIFTVKPAHDLLRDERKLITIQMIPKEARTYKCILNCQLYSTATVFTKKLSFFGSGETPKISLENAGRLFFMPTCIETTSSRYYSIRNMSRIPLRFEWKHSNLAQSKIVKVHSSSGTILPYEIQEHRWYFSPLEAKNYELSSILLTSIKLAEESPLNSPRKYKAIVDIYGVGKTAVLQCGTSSHDFGTVIVGTSKHDYLSLTNMGSCDLQYALSINQQTDHKDSDNLVEVVPMRGVIHTRSTIQCKVTVHACQNVLHHYTISYKQISHFEEESNADGHSLCDIRFNGAFPSFSIIDVVGQGAASQISKANLWKMLSIDKINKVLRDIPDASELRYTIATRHSLQHTLPAGSKTMVDCDFGAAPINSEDFMVSILIKNDGDVTTEWAFQKSTDIWLEPEYWADYGTLDDAEKQELSIINNELFIVSPPKGSLDPGESTMVMLVYRHKKIGYNKLPLQLKINKGREILLNICGVTVKRGNPYLHISDKEHFIDPVPIGVHSPPRQILALHNGGDAVLGYEVDTAVFEHLTERNFCMPIFEFLQPTGQILPGKTLPLEIIFSPVEAKKYSVDVPVHLSTGNTAIVTLVGEGYECNSQSFNPKQKIISGTITRPECMANLSFEIINYGCVPQFATVRRVVFVNNISQHTLSFFWELESQNFSKVITVEPNEGYIQPGRTAVCKLTFYPCSSSFNYNFDLICKVRDESEYSCYNAFLYRWKEKSENEECIITSDEHQSLSKSVPGHHYKLSSDVKNVLPPICDLQDTYDDWKNRDLSKRSKKRPTVRKSLNNEPPVPPKLHLLPLTVTAKVISISDYVSLHGNLEKNFIDYSTLTSLSPSANYICKDELDFLKVILNQILKEILEDYNFQQALSRVTAEPIPYFSQFSTLKIVTKNELQCRPNSCTIVESGKSDVDHGDNQQVMSERLVHLQDASFKSAEDKDQTIINNEEVYSVVEDAVESTLMNIFVEVTSGEFSINRPLCTIIKSGTN